MATPVRPRCYLDLQHGTDPIGRVVIELYNDKVPKTCENFRVLCNGSKGAELHYKSTRFHRIIEEFMIQGGDITRGDGKGGKSIYGDTFEDENLKWSEIDREGLVCMANRGPDTNSSQFFITCAPCTHINFKHTVFGHVVSGMQFVKQVETVKTNADDVPVVDVIISNCGELEFRRAPAKPLPTSTNTDTKSSRDRKRRRSRSRSRSRSASDRNRSRSPQKRSDRRRDGDRHNRDGKDRDRRRRSERDSRDDRGRHRGSDRRPSSRSRSPRRLDPLPEPSRNNGSRSPPGQNTSAAALQNDNDYPASRDGRPTSVSPSRSVEAPGSPVNRKESRPANQHRYRSRSRSRGRYQERSGGAGRRHYSHDHDYDSEEEERIRQEEEERESVRRNERSPPSWRRRGGGGRERGGDRYQPEPAESAVKFKGRGSMKYRERSGWGGNNGGFSRFGRLN